MRGIAERGAVLGLGLLAATVSLGAADDLRLVQAARHQNRAAVRALLTQRVDTAIAEADGATALHWAAHWDDLETARLLLQAGAQVDTANALGVTPLALAATNGSAAMIGELLKGGANPNTALANSGETVLMLAARTGHVEAVKTLLARNAAVNAKGTPRVQTALMWAASEGHGDVVRVLIEGGADVHARSSEGFTPLHFAARGGDVATTRLLLDAGATIDDPDKAGRTPLLVAVHRGHVPLAEQLLDRGADPNINTAGYTVLHWVAGSWETVVLFDNTAGFKEWNALTGLRGETKISFLKVLLARGANPNARTTKPPPKFGYTSTTAANTGKENFGLTGASPFLLAARAGDTAAMRILAAAGADPLLPTEDGLTPLMQAAGIGRVAGESRVTERMALDATTLALDFGGKVDQRDDYGNTALIGATWEGFDSVIQFLLERGANVNIKNGNEDTPLMIAEGRAHRRTGINGNAGPSTVALLKKSGAVE